MPSGGTALFWGGIVKPPQTGSSCGQKPSSARGWAGCRRRTASWATQCARLCSCCFLWSPVKRVLSRIRTGQAPPWNCVLYSVEKFCQAAFDLLLRHHSMHRKQGNSPVQQMFCVGEELTSPPFFEVLTILNSKFSSKRISSQVAEDLPCV